MSLPAATVATDEIRKGLIVCLLDLAGERDENGTILTESAAKMRKAAEMLGDDKAITEMAKEMGNER